MGPRCIFQFPLHREDLCYDCIITEKIDGTNFQFPLHREDLCYSCLLNVRSSLENTLRSLFIGKLSVTIYVIFPETITFSFSSLFIGKISVTEKPTDQVFSCLAFSSLFIGKISVTRIRHPNIPSSINLSVPSSSGRSLLLNGGETGKIFLSYLSVPSSSGRSLLLLHLLLLIGVYMAFSSLFIGKISVTLPHRSNGPGDFHFQFPLHREDLCYSITPVARFFICVTFSSLFIGKISVTKFLT